MKVMIDRIGREGANSDRYQVISILHRKHTGGCNFSKDFFSRSTIPNPVGPSPGCDAGLGHNSGPSGKVVS